ncbi:FecCD family ABC transporter permease [Amorphus sp. 3PC139-8]|uniref:FecCD family ABC transporter permease n=1 Tax=Amorphus sp. 3PC139-8 TaxID=2735676 RepID=UPI00345CC840
MRTARRLDGRRVLRFASGLDVPLANLAAAGFLLVLVLMIMAYALGVGATALGIGDALRAVVGAGIGDGQAFALWQVRLPHILLGFMAGWCVALSGAMLQSLSQNPLADPGLLGLSQGAMVALMVLLVFFPGLPHGLAPFVALAGGLGVAALILFLVGWDQADGLAILLMGIALETTLSAVASLLLLYTPPETSYALSNWLAGSLFGASWSVIAGFAPWFALSLPVILLVGRSLKSFDLGDETALALGENVRRSRPAILVAAVLLTSASVTAVGPLIFLGVIAPHIADAISRSTGRTRLVLSALVGGLLVVAGDTLTRANTSDVALPTGLAITIIGVPLFIATLRLRALRTVQ